ncbi:hypothetical protein [Roseibium sediminicola]|uniref:Uncharacterized protein n=1 Tax=Roseibium sediminicola TaxID=2933272 RepID=A0ABT0GWJ2_9HYPH|nr:hypothetical protein [Roseibium sp. CAU 1639]MCK7613814.1 hypothetical protein [Roseibium sp. CAU 1639]
MRKWLLKQLMTFISRRVEKEVQELRNSIKGNPHVADFKVEKALKADFGREVARMHWSHRPFASRYDIVRISHADKQILVPILGLDGENNIGIAKLGYDLRSRLGISKTDLSNDRKIQLTIDLVGWWGQLYWYLNTKEPAVKVPAWLAFWSVLLGFAGLLLALLSMIF